jgi:hypothetical protein
MTKLSKVLLAAALIASGPAMAAANDCPQHEPGYLPWLTNGIAKGDLWAWVYLELDKDARPKRCLMGDNNIHDADTRFLACDAMTESWKPATDADAKAVASTTVKRLFILPGPNRNKEIREAKTLWFAQHPDQRPECYPDD